MNFYNLNDIYLLATANGTKRPRNVEPSAVLTWRGCLRIPMIDGWITGRVYCTAEENGVLKLTRKPVENPIDMFTLTYAGTGNGRCLSAWMSRQLTNMFSDDVAYQARFLYHVVGSDTIYLVPMPKPESIEVKGVPVGMLNRKALTAGGNGPCIRLSANAADLLEASGQFDENIIVEYSEESNVLRFYPAEERDDEARKLVRAPSGIYKQFSITNTIKQALYGAEKGLECPMGVGEDGWWYIAPKNNPIWKNGIIA